MAEKRVYFFGGGKAEGNAKMKVLLGGKGANLAEMTNLGVPVPAGLVEVSTDGPTVQVLQGTFEAGTVVGVTVEPASGSEQPTTEPIVAIATA